MLMELAEESGMRRQVGVGEGALDQRLAVVELAVDGDGA